MIIEHLIVIFTIKFKSFCVLSHYQSHTSVFKTCISSSKKCFQHRKYSLQLFKSMFWLYINFRKITIIVGMCDVIMTIDIFTYRKATKLEM